MPVRIKLPAKARPSASSRSKSASGGGGRKKLRTPRSRFLALLIDIFAMPAVRYGLLAVAGILVVVAVWVGLEYRKYARLTDGKLLSGPFPNSSLLYAAPQIVGVGDPGGPLQFATRLRESGYVEDVRSNPRGWYHIRPAAIEVFPGQGSYSRSEPGVLKFDGGKVSAIISLSDNSPRTQYTMEPRLLSSLFDRNREKRRLVKYDDIPPVLVHAVVSVEDKRFFQHSGFDPIRFVKAALVDIRERRFAQGASTLTQQLARNIWLDARKTYGRKFDELLITIHLERKLTKQKIFEYYANQVDLGRRGSFAIRGFGEAAQAYFGKDLHSLTLSEAATLAGLIQQPSRFNPVRYPERARTRRNIVLRQMLENKYITDAQYREALAADVVTARQGIESADAPYFVDLVNERLANQFGDQDFQESGSRIYTTLDPDLQRDAAESIGVGLKEVNTLLARRAKKGESIPDPQVALICMDPHTGEIKALIGGKNYGVSQLNHAVSKRPSGSIFKPFVYAAALNTGLDGGRPDPWTGASVVKDELRTFYFSGQPYEPADFHKGEMGGDVTLRTAFAKSLNIPAVEVAEAVGYNTVANLAHQAGLADIRATPAMALGAYNVTPLEITTAFSLFANDGVMVKNRLISEIVNRDGGDSWHSQPETQKILDSRINYLVVSLMGEVLRSGTGAGVRARGFSLPAAAKTGSSHDAWFAGFTSRLLCVVWVGLDDYQDLKLNGDKAALPIWAEFMRRAHKHRAYRDVSEFPAPDGVVSSQVDSATGQLATNLCPPKQVVTEYFLVGTQPVAFCPLHQGGATQIAGWDSTGLPSTNLPNLNAPVRSSYPSAATPASGQQDGRWPGGNSPVTAQNPSNPAESAGAPYPKEQKPKEKKGLFDKLKGIFK